MSKDDRDILEVLKEELDFLEQGGYGRSVRTPWKPTSAFQDSLICINYGYPYRAHPCSECFLLEFVPVESRATPIPCHHIPLNEEAAPETIATLELQGDDDRKEDLLKGWLGARINEIEAQRAVQS
jgi:hypothetical protein